MSTTKKIEIELDVDDAIALGSFEDDMKNHLETVAMNYDFDERVFFANEDEITGSTTFEQYLEYEKEYHLKQGYSLVNYKEHYETENTEDNRQHYDHMLSCFMVYKVMNQVRDAYFKKGNK